jgi:D-alanyl-D-alanine carboxypeptidase
LKKASLFKHFALCMAFQAVALPAVTAQEKPPEPARADRYASIVVDAQTGQTLYARDGNQQLRPASTTKIMTAYLTFEALRNGTLRLDQELTVSRRAASQERTNLAMLRTVTVTDKKTGKKRTEQQQVIRKITVEDALKGMLVHSANDAAVVLAEAIGGSVEGFAVKMNGAAAKIGMNESHFMNPNGLPHARQYTTVSDMAKLSAAVIAEYPEYYHFFGNRTFRYNGISYRNYNNLLGSYDGVDGLKTGYIRTSGFNLAASAERDGKRIVAVVFGADNPAQRKADMIVLLDYGFAALGGLQKPPLPQDNPTPQDDSGDPEETAFGLPPEARAKASGATGFGFFTPQPPQRLHLAAANGPSRISCTGGRASFTAAPFKAAPAQEFPGRDAPRPEKQPFYPPRPPFARARGL